MVELRYYAVEPRVFFHLRGILSLIKRLKSVAKLEQKFEPIIPDQNLEGYDRLKITPSLIPTNPGGLVLTYKYTAKLT